MQAPTNPAEVYEQYLGQTIAEPFARALTERAAPRHGERVLDLACGTGAVARQVAPLVGAEGKVLGIDISAAMLSVARSLPVPDGAPIEWLEGDATALKLADRVFDLVLCQQGLQFFSDRRAALLEMRRVLDMGGRLALSVWQGLDHHPVYEALFLAVAHRLALQLSDLDVSFSLGRAEDLRELVINAGFQCQRIEECSLDVRLPFPMQFVRFTVVGAATSVPAFARLDQAARTDMIDTITRELAPLVGRYTRGDTLQFRMSTHIVIAS
jgi:ubiquinone/menaquinone biosynthesis C-methylase UbiE